MYKREFQYQGCELSTDHKGASDYKHTHLHFICFKGMHYTELQTVVQEKALSRSLSLSLSHELMKI